MLTFFRTIRRSLLESRSIKKYILYAMGEIALVVVGILIALQVNEWNEGRNNLNKTREYVQRLINDLRADSTMFVNHVKDATLKAQYCKDIRKVLDEGQILSDTGKFVLSLQSVGRLDLPPISDNTFKDMQSSGNLNLIDDFIIREAIRNYYNEIPYWWFDQYSSQLVEGYLPIAVDAIPMRIHEEILNAEKGQAGVPSLYYSSDEVQIKPQELNETISKISDNKEYDFNLKRINRSHLVHVKLLTNMQKNVNELIKLLKDWISR